VAVGSRGIHQFKHIVRGRCLAELKTAGAKPFLLPAREARTAQRPRRSELLKSYGITSKAWGDDSGRGRESSPSADAEDVSAASGAAVGRHVIITA